MQKCFYDGKISVGSLELSMAESHHLCHVMRAKIGQQVTILNGQGDVATGKIFSFNKKFATIRVTEVKKVHKVVPSINLLQSVLTNNNNDFIVREATAIGVDKIIFFSTQNSECKIKNKVDNKLDRWTSIAVEACKQSGNPFLPEISYCSEFTSINFSEFQTKLFGGLSDNSISLRDAITRYPMKSVGIMIGPEGDFSDFEYDFLRRNGFMECRFATNVLRSETAAIYAISVIDQLTRTIVL